LKESHSAITLQNDELEFHRKQLLASNRTKDQVLAVIGHDLKTPFATAQQSIGLIRSGDLDTDEQEMVLEAFEKQVIQVSQMLNDLLSWAYSQQGGAKLNKEPLDLSAVVEEVLQVYDAPVKGKALSLLHGKNGDKLLVLADHPRLKIILQNIIGNAIKFTPRGGTITITYTRNDTYTAVHIRDSGNGISDEKKALLFKSFGQAISEPGTENETGTGLGLLLVQEFIRENGGNIEVVSEPGKGAEFVVSFPAFSNKTG
jgi:signal transduction histidine kinase